MLIASHQLLRFEINSTFDYLVSGHNALLKSPFVLVWLEKCLTVLETDSSQLRTEVIAFMLRLSALVVENEWLLAPIREKRIFLR